VQEGVDVVKMCKFIQHRRGFMLNNDTLLFPSCAVKKMQAMAQHDVQSGARPTGTIQDAILLRDGGM